MASDMPGLLRNLALQESRHLQFVKTEHRQGKRNENQCKPTERPGILEERGKFEEAEKFYKRAMLILQEALNPFDGALITLMESYGGMLRKCGRDDEADYMKACALGRVSGNMRTVTGSHLPEL